MIEPMGGAASEAAARDWGAVGVDAGAMVLRRKGLLEESGGSAMALASCCAVPTRGNMSRRRGGRTGLGGERKPGDPWRDRLGDSV